MPSKKPISEPAYLRPAAASKYSGLSERTLHLCCQQGVIKSHCVVMPGRQRSRIRLIDVADLRRFIERGSAVPEKIAIAEERP